MISVRIAYTLYDLIYLRLGVCCMAKMTAVWVCLYLSSVGALRRAISGLVIVSYHLSLIHRDVICYDLLFILLL